MIADTDSRVIDQCFDHQTLASGRAYASKGAVLDVHWDPGGRRVAGTVSGSQALYYEVSVDLVRAPNGRLVSVDGECTCPVTYDCKHAVALLLVTLDAGGDPTSAPTKKTSERVAAQEGMEAKGDSGAPTWDSVLGTLLEDARRDVPADGRLQGAVALQFELVVGGSAADRSTLSRRLPGTQNGATPMETRIRLRPVVRGSSGNWVRTGFSWRTIDYLETSWNRRQIPSAQIPVLKELRALSSLARSRTYYSSHSDDDVWLDSIASRRIWDLLDEAEDADIPLVGAGRTAAPVTVHRSAAALGVDARRVSLGSAPGDGIVLRPLLTVGALDVPIAGGTHLLIATPPHGIAWWDAASSGPTDDTPHLSFARLPAARTALRCELLSGKTLFVPAADEERFFCEAYPRLRRLVQVESGDASVVLPELPDEALILTLSHLGGHELRLEWTTGPPGSASREPLHFGGRHPDDEKVARAIAEATRFARQHPTGHVLAPRGDRLEPEASLQGMSTVRFLSDVLSDLEAVPGLVVEHIGERVEYREAEEAPAVSLKSIGEGECDWFDLAVEVRVGAEDVRFVELFVALAGGQSHMVLPSGTYFSLEDHSLRELAQLIEEARALKDADGDHIRVNRYQASLWEDFKRLGVVTAQAAEWERSVRALATATDRPDHAAPAGLVGCMRPYQHVGFNWLAFLYELGLGGILADDMGLGKTLQVLALVSHVRERRLDERPFLVVAPTSVVGNWASECAKFTPGLRVATVHATSARRDTTLFDLAAGADVVVTSYALFRLEYEQYEKVEWAGLVLDEAQFAKNVHSHAYQRAKALPVRFKLAVTGTPMENHLMELWALVSITAPGLFGSAERFNEHYRLPIERRRDEDRLGVLRRRIRPLLLRRSKESVAADLPAKQEQVIELELAPRHRKLYQTYLQRERQKILGLLADMQQNRFEILKSLTVLRQASLDVRLVDPGRTRIPSTKLDALMEMLEEVVADGHRVLVFSQFTRYLSMARARVKEAGLAHCYLDGRTRKRTAVLSEFRTGNAPVFLISLKAGGFGLNLTEADYCILLDPWWNPATEAQAIDRAHRIGQTKSVMVYRLVAKETIEEKVMELKARKAALFRSVVDGGGFESGALSAADIRGLLD